MCTSSVDDWFDFTKECSLKLWLSLIIPWHQINLICHLICIVKTCTPPKHEKHLFISIYYIRVVFLVLFATECKLKDFFFLKSFVLSHWATWRKPTIQPPVSARFHSKMKTETWDPGFSSLFHNVLQCSHKWHDFWKEWYNLIRAYSYDKS